MVVSASVASVLVRCYGLLLKATSEHERAAAAHQLRACTACITCSEESEHRHRRISLRLRRAGVVPQQRTCGEHRKGRVAVVDPVSLVVLGQVSSLPCTHEPPACSSACTSRPPQLPPTAAPTTAPTAACFTSERSADHDTGAALAGATAAASEPISLRSRSRRHGAIAATAAASEPTSLHSRAASVVLQQQAGEPTSLHSRAADLAGATAAGK